MQCDRRSGDEPRGMAKSGESISEVGQTISITSLENLSR
jgi:hypothetical protein